MTTGYPSWESVLAEVEADVAHTEALLDTVTTSSGRLRLGPLAPAELMLPPAPVLPEPATMPRVPDELIERFAALRDRIAGLGQELVAALEDAGRYLASPAGTEMAVVPARPAPPPRYLDRAL